MNERKIPAAILALSVHLVLLAILIFGFRWQTSEPVALEAQIWQDLPPPPVPERHPERKPVQKPEPPKPVKPAPPPPEVQKPNPDIALKKAREEKQKQDEIRKLEKQKQEEKLKEQEKLQEQEKLKEEKQKEQEKRKELQKEQQAKKRIQQQQDDLMKKVAEREAAAKASLIDKYKAMIKSRIRRFVVVPPGIQGNPEAVFEVILLPDGEVLRATMVSSSGIPAYDAAVERAIMRASPLPLPPDPSLFGDFRDLRLTFRPNE